MRDLPGSASYSYAETMKMTLSERCWRRDRGMRAADRFRWQTRAGSRVVVHINVLAEFIQALEEGGEPSAVVDVSERQARCLKSGGTVYERSR